MRVALALLFSMMAAPGAWAAGSAEKVLADRCVAAIAESGEHVDAKSLRKESTPLGDSGYLFQFHAADGSAFVCQVCDDTDAKLNCGTMGLMLSLRPVSGESRHLPAELDKKCVFYLQKELKPRGSGHDIDHALVDRIRVTPAHTDSRWLYEMSLDGADYRCVIRKSDGSFRVERHAGDDWRPLAAGVMF